MQLGPVGQGRPYPLGMGLQLGPVAGQLCRARGVTGASLDQVPEGGRDAIDLPLVLDLLVIIDVNLRGDAVHLRQGRRVGVQGQVIAHGPFGRVLAHSRNLGFSVKEGSAAVRNDWPKWDS